MIRQIVGILCENWYKGFYRILILSGQFTRMHTFGGTLELRSSTTNETLFVTM